MMLCLCCCCERVGDRRYPKFESITGPFFNNDIFVQCVVHELQYNNDALGHVTSYLVTTAYVVHNICHPDLLFRSFTGRLSVDVTRRYPTVSANSSPINNSMQLTLS